MGPGLFCGVSSSLVDVAPVSSNRPRVLLFSSLLHFHPTTSASGEINSCKLGVFRSHCFLLPFLRLIFNKHSQIGLKKPCQGGSTPECVLVCAHVYVSCCCSGICYFARACVRSRAVSARDRTRGTDSHWPAAIRWAVSVLSQPLLPLRL